MTGSLYFIKSQFNGRVLDVKDGSTDRDTQIIVWPQKSGNDCLNQLWRREGNYLINAKSTKALDIRGGSMDEGNSIIQYDQKGYEEAANQQWMLEEAEGGSYYICNSSRPDLVLDIEGRSDDDGAHVILYRKRNGEVASNQRWYLEEYRR